MGAMYLPCVAERGPMDELKPGETKGAFALFGEVPLNPDPFSPALCAGEKGHVP